MSICFDHVSLRVTNLEHSIIFYQNVMGLELVDRREDGSQAVFRIGEALLVLFCRPEYKAIPPESTSGTDHIAFCLDGESYDILLERLNAQDLVLRGPTLNKGAPIGSVY